MTPLVSVLVAAYKADDYLELALRDALAQTYPAVEVIVSDDAAAADTRAVVERLADSRLVYRTNPTRLGAAGNHREALRTARGEFVAILNHDDRWEPGFLAAVVPPMAADSSVVLGFCDHRVIDASGADVPGRADELAAHYGRDRLTPGRQPSLARLTVDQTVPLAMGSAFRRSAVDPDALTDAAGPAYDLWLTYLLARTGGGAVYVPDRLTAWRAHPANQTSAASRAWTDGATRCWQAALADPAFAAERPAVRRKLAVSHRAAAAAALRAGDRAAAIRSAALGWKARPAEWKSAAMLGLAVLPFGRRAVGR